MKVLFCYTHMFPKSLWEKAAQTLAGQGIFLTFHRQGHVLPDSRFDLVIADLTRGLPGFDESLGYSRTIPHRLWASGETIDAFTTFSRDDRARFMDYLDLPHEKNFCHSIFFLARILGEKCACDGPEPVLACGIYHPAAPGQFTGMPEYTDWYAGILPVPPQGKRVGMVCSLSQVAQGQTQEIDYLIRELEGAGLMPVCVFTQGVPDRAAAGADPLASEHQDHGPEHAPYDWIRLLAHAGTGILLNLMAGRLLARPGHSRYLAWLDIPVIQLVKSWTHDLAGWEADLAGLKSHSVVYSLSQPEMSGVVSPTLVACTRDPEEGARTGEYLFDPHAGRMSSLVRQVGRWLALRATPNAEKRLTIVLHNNPCKGVESTVGMAVGLDTFDSLATLVRDLARAGYDTGNCPFSGQAIKEMIFEKKAFSEFRWTTVDEILTKGGALALVRADAYLPWFSGLPELARAKVEKDWGPFPGQGMVAETHGQGPALVVTGLEFGRLRIMVQPKRGCYGAKCNGEVCRILHEPDLAPPHHWLATYRYIQEHSDAVIHFGTEGALEYLPGKGAVLSDACFPEISLGDLPNFYLYCMDVPGEGLMAKRRGRAVIVDHLSPVLTAMGSHPDMARLEQLLDQYQKADALDEADRRQRLAEQMIPMAKQLGLAEDERDFPLLARQIQDLKTAFFESGRHVLGLAPDPAQMDTMIDTLVRAMAMKGEGSEACAPDALNNTPLAKEWTVPDPSLPLHRQYPGIARNLLAAAHETNALIRALDGCFVPPGLGGSFYQGKLETLPTGRNFYPTDISALPTRTAWERGCALADALLARYLEEEGAFPYNVGVSIWSSDAFKSDGEVFSQVLWLLGVRPVWAENSRVAGLEVVPLAQLVLKTCRGILNRPRVDVTIQTSGIMRDMVPHFCDLLDQAVVMVSALDEPAHANFVAQRIQDQVRDLKEQLGADLPDPVLRRMASFRVFSSKPGTYGLGVGLALDASAWKSDKDLAEAYVNWGGYAYGSAKSGLGPARFGEAAHQLLARQLGSVDISYMKQSDIAYDLLDCGGYAVFQGGMALAARALGPTGKKVRLYWGEASCARISDLGTRINTSARAKLLNPAWLEQQKPHGFQGAAAVAAMVNNLFKLAATTQAVDAKLFDRVADLYVRDKANAAWLTQANPHAAEELTRRLLEAHGRSLWHPDPDRLQKVRDLALDVEGDMEEQMGEVKGESQGSSVDVMTREDVDLWNPQFTIKT